MKQTFSNALVEWNSHWWLFSRERYPRNSTWDVQGTTSFCPEYCWRDSKQCVYLDKYVQIRGEALSPFSGDNWKTIEKRFTAKQFGKLPSFCNFELTQPAKSADKIRVTLVLSESAYGVKGLQSIINFKDFTYSSDGPKYGVKLNIDKARKVVRNTSQSVTIKINFVPKPVPSRARAKEK